MENVSQSNNIFSPASSHMAKKFGRDSPDNIRFMKPKVINETMSEEQEIIDNIE